MKYLTQYIITKDLIRKAHNINRSIPKGLGTYSSDYDYYYNQKKLLIEKIAEKIKEFQLPIKYGVKNGCIYFAFEGQQFSFHGTYNITKPYNGAWIGKGRKNATINGKLPGKNNLYW